MTNCSERSPLETDSTAKRIAIVYEHPPLDSPELLDTLVQRDAIVQSLQSQGHRVQSLAMTLNLEQVHRELREQKPDLIFNLVEGLAGNDRLMGLATLLYEALGIPFTGCPSLAIVSTNDKLAAKRRLLSAGLPTPDAWYVEEGELRCLSHEVHTEQSRSAATSEAPFRVIIKAIGEHASVGLDDNSVIRVTGWEQIASAIQEAQQRTGKPYFAEAFVEGLEWNVSLLHGQVMPIAEIQFENWPDDKPRIVGFDAKWSEESHAYQNTPRSFELSPTSSATIDQVRRDSAMCWSLFHLRGAARVDWRVDEQGQPWILEINANPCLSPDGGFIAGCRERGIDFDGVMQQLVERASC